MGLVCSHPSSDSIENPRLNSGSEIVKQPVKSPVKQPEVPKPDVKEIEKSNNSTEPSSSSQFMKKLSESQEKEKAEKEKAEKRKASDDSEGNNKLKMDKFMSPMDSKEFAPVLDNRQEPEKEKKRKIVIEDDGKLIDGEKKQKTKVLNLPGKAYLKLSEYIGKEDPKTFFRFSMIAKKLFRMCSQVSKNGTIGWKRPFYLKGNTENLDNHLESVEKYDFLQTYDPLYVTEVILSQASGTHLKIDELSKIFSLISKQYPDLKRLSFQGLHFKQDCIKLISDVFQTLPKLKEIGLVKSSFKGISSTALGDVFQKQGKLKTLVVISNTASPPLIFGSFKYLEELKELHLTCGKNYFPEQEEISNQVGDCLKKLKNLTNFHFFGNVFTMDNQKLIFNSLKSNNTLKYLLLENNSFHGVSIQYVANVIVTCPALETVKLSQNCIDDDDMQQLSEFFSAERAAKSVTFLDLKNNFITEKGAFFLGRSIAWFPKLENLRVCGNKIGDNGLYSIVEGAKNIELNLKGFFCSDCDLRDDCVHTLVNLLFNNRNLKRLDISGHKMNPTELEELCATIRQTRSVKQLMIKTDKMEHKSMSILKHLKKKLPHMKIDVLG